MEFETAETQKNCRNCGGEHHQSLCIKGHTERSSEEKKDENNEKVPSKAQDQESILTASSQVTNKKQVLLQTSRSVAVNETNSRKIPVRVLFDNGSQRTYITSNLRTKLNLKPTTTEILHLNTFGETTCKSKKYNVFQLNLQKPNTNMVITIRALEFPVICSPVPSSVHINYPHLRAWN